MRVAPQKCGWKVRYDEGDDAFKNEHDVHNLNKEMAVES